LFAHVFIGHKKYTGGGILNGRQAASSLRWTEVFDKYQKTTIALVIMAK
jgi:hypothetical protein